MGGIQKMHLTFKTNHGWAGQVISFYISHEGNGTIKRELKCTDGSKFDVLIPEQFIEWFDAKKEMQGIYFKEPMKKDYAITVHAISNEALVDFRYMKEFTFGFNSSKYSVLFSEKKFTIINQNSYYFYKDYKKLDLSSRENFCKSINRIIFMHELSKESLGINHHAVRQILFYNNFTNVDALYNEVISRGYYD